jgi:dienelactone hydrolase
MFRREDAAFPVGGANCAAWLYRPDSAPVSAATEAGVPCVVMAHGFSLTRHEGLDAYAERFAAAGAAVVAFDHRYLGDSGGAPRQRFRKRAQLEDWRAAIEYARALAGIDPERIVLWGFSFSGGHVVTLAERDHRLAAVIALCPFVNGFRRVMSTPLLLAAWIMPRALADLAGRHNLIPVTAPSGGRAAMTLPGERDGFAKIVLPSSSWRNEISPAVFATVAFHRPLTRASQIRCPIWIGVGDRDVSVDRRSIERLATKTVHSQLERYPFDHFEPFLPENIGRVAADQIAFLAEHGLVTPETGQARARPAMIAQSRCGGAPAEA